MAGQLHRLDVDHSEPQAALLEAVRGGGAFDVRMVRLQTGDYLIDNEVLIERRRSPTLPHPLPMADSSHKRPDWLIVLVGPFC